MTAIGAVGEAGEVVHERVDPAHDPAQENVMTQVQKEAVIPVADLTPKLDLATKAIVLVSKGVFVSRIFLSSPWILKGVSATL